MEPGYGGRRDPLAWAAVGAGVVASFREAYRWSDGTTAIGAPWLTVLWAALVPPLLALALDGVRRWESGRLGRLGLGALGASWTGLALLSLVALLVLFQGRNEAQLVPFFAGVDLATLGFLMLSAVLVGRGTPDRGPYLLLFLGTVGFVVTIDSSSLAVLPGSVGYPLAVAAAGLGPAWLWLGARRLRHPEAYHGRHHSLPWPRRIVVLGSIALLLVAMMAVEGVSTRSARSLLHPARESSDSTPGSVNRTFEEIHLATEDGVSLFGWWVPATGNVTKCTVVFLHGYGDNRTQGLDVTPWLTDAGYHLLLFDFRAHGRSGGAFTTIGLDEVRDVKAAVDYVGSRHDTDPDCIGLFGYSMGAATALNYVADDPRISAVVADSPFSDLQNIVANSFRHFTCDTGLCLPRYPFGPLTVLAGGWVVDRDLINNVPARAARDLERAVFLIHGENDTIVTTRDDHERLADAIGPAAEEWIVKDAGHVNARRVAKGEYERRILDFLDRHLV